MAHSSEPNVRPGHAENDQEHDSSASAASVAVSLIGYARRILELDNMQTEYSAQYLVDNACPKKEDGQGGMDLKLTVKDCLEFAFQEGIPKADSWPHLGCPIKPPSSYKPALVSMKGEVVEAKTLKEAFKLLRKQPVGAKLHVFSPAFDLVGEKGIYRGPSSNFSYVGLRDVIITGHGRSKGKEFAEVRISDNRYIKVAADVRFIETPEDEGSEVNEATSKPTGLLVDFCVPRFSIE